MSLTDKLSNGLAVLVIQGQIPCLTTFEILWLPLVKVAELLPNGCTEAEPCTQPPVPVTSTMTPPDFGGDIMSSFLAKKSMLDADMREYAQRDRGAGDVQEGLGWRIL